MPFNEGGPVTDYKADVGPGWHPLLDQLHRELMLVDPGYRTVQVKEKFGNLRVYIDTAAGDAAWNVISKFENLSSGICEACGKPGGHTKTVWIKTLCDDCAALSLSQRKRMIAGNPDAAQS
jgi:hypothetical protein